MDKVTERLAEIKKRRAEIDEELKEADKEQIEKLEKEVDDLNTEQEQLRKERLEVLNERGRNIEMPADRKRNKEDKDDEDKDPYDTLEYRRAFRNYIMHRDKSIFKRADETTETDDVGAIVPTTISDEVVQKLKDFGDIFNKVTVTNFQGGVEIPVGGTKPTAEWTSEGSVADKQKQSMDDTITFSYHKLQIRVAQTLLASTVSLDVWERVVAQNIAEAMVVKIEEAIISGDGSGKPEGIVEASTDVIPSENRIDFQTSDADYKGWVNKLIGNIPLAYRKRRNGVVLMNPATWDKYVQGLVDDNGQPVARTTYGLNGELSQRFLGREVILREEIPSLDEASDGDTVVIYGDLSEYIVNTNMQIRQRNYFDEDTDEYIQKSTMILDGKLADGYGFVLLNYDDGA